MKPKEVMEFLPAYFDRLLEDSTAEKPAWNMEMIRSGRETIWSYVDACVLKAALDFYDMTGEERYFTFVEEFLDWYVQEDGGIRTYEKTDWNIDNICPGKNLFDVYKRTGKEKYRKALDLLQSQLDEMPRTKEGNFWHKNIYPWQVWLDGLYMGLPFYMQYELEYREGKHCKDIFNQFRNVYRLLRKENGLYYHGYDESRSMYWADKNTGCSPHCWVRATGWLMAALADILEIADKEKYSEDVIFLQKMTKELVEALKPWQHKSGMFYQVVDKPEEKGNYLETSGTMLIAYGILKAVRLGYLDISYQKIAVDAFWGTTERYLKKTERGEFVLGGICLVAGLGGEGRRDGSLAYYFSEPVVENEGKGVAPMLLCYTELLRANVIV